MQLPIDPPVGHMTEEMCVWTGANYLSRGIIQAHIFLYEHPKLPYHVVIYLAGKPLVNVDTWHGNLDDALKEVRQVFARERKKWVDNEL